MTTGFATQQRNRIIWRDQGMCCRCSGNQPTDIHHRLPRGMGGSPSANRLSNGVLLCRACHDWIERNRQAALTTGWLVPRGGDPAGVPITNIWGQTRWLTEEGTITTNEEGSP